MKMAHLVRTTTDWGTSPARMKKAAGCVVLLWAACAAMSLHASELQPLAAAMVETKGHNDYFEPVTRRIVIRSQPIRLFIRLRNTSDAQVLIRIDAERYCSIELKDQAGLTMMVKRKPRTDEETDDERQVGLAPGEDKIVPLNINTDAWEGFPALTPGKESKYAARVIYETADGQLVSSETYTLIFNIAE